MNSAKKIEVLFPGKEVVIKIGDVEVPVLITPLSLLDLPKVAQAFGRLMKLAESGGKEFSSAELAARGLEELLSLIPYCINLPPEKIPATEVPDILEIVIEQNITSDVVGKWGSLVQKLVEVTGDKLKKAPSETKKPQ